MKYLLPFFLFCMWSTYAYCQKAAELEGQRWINTDEAFTISKLEGKVILLDFWGVWCKSCIDAIPKLNHLSSRFSDNFLIISVHTPKRSENLEELFRENNYLIPTLVDKVPEGEGAGYYGVTTKKYRVKAFPSYVLIDKEGEIIGGIRSKVPSEEMIEELIKAN